MHRALSSTLLILLLSLLQPLHRFQADPPPDISAVTPASAANDLATPISITGMNFQVGAWAALARPPADPVPLTGGNYLGSGTLTAVVPWGLEPGQYTLTVTNPDGQSAAWAAPFTVINGMDAWRTGGPYGGHVNQILIEPQAPYAIYAAVGGVGVFLSMDHGGSWQKIMTMPAYVAVALDTTVTPPVLYVVRDNATLLRTTDRGATWMDVPLGDTGYDYYGARVFTGPDGALYVGVRHYLVRTNDLGATWMTLMEDHTGDIFYTALAFDPKNTSRVFAGRSDGLVVGSTYGGAPGSWGTMGQAPSAVNQIVVDPTDGTLWIASTGGYQHGNGDLRHYKNGGMLPVEIWPDNPGASQVAWLTFNPEWPGTMYAVSNSDAWWSQDGGANWLPLVQGFSYGDAIALDPADNDTLYLGWGGYGVYKSIYVNNGRAFVPSSNGIAGIVPQSLAIDPQDPANLYADGVSDLYHSTDGGERWQVVPTEYYGSGRLLVDHFDTTTRVITGMRGGLAYSDDAGQSWTNSLVLDPPGQIDDNRSWGSPVRAEAGGVTRLVAAYSASRPDASDPYVNTILVSEDHAATWKAAARSSEAFGQIKNLTFAPSDPSILYAVEGWPSGRVLKSADAGLTWSPAGLEGYEIFALAVDPDNPQVVYAGVRDGGEHMAYSGNGGVTWEQRGSFNNYGLENLYAIPEHPSTLYATGWNGMRVSHDQGVTWQTPDSPFASTNIGAMVYLMQPDHRLTVYIATAGGFASQAQPLRAQSAEPLLAAGVYRKTVQYHTVYLPAVGK